MAARHGPRPTPLTSQAAAHDRAGRLATALFLLLEYPSLPDLLPVHFNGQGAADGWQYRTLPRVLIPVGVQALLALLFRGRRRAAAVAPARRTRTRWRPTSARRAAAAEAVMLLALIWVTFQGYAAFALARLWVSSPGDAAVLQSRSRRCAAWRRSVVAVRAHRQLGRPDPRPFVAAHWRPRPALQEP